MKMNIGDPDCMHVMEEKENKAEDKQQWKCEKKPRQTCTGSVIVG